MRTPQRVVWKFSLRWGEVGVDMPQYARILHVGMDPASDYPAIWALVDPEAEKSQRRFVVVGTGHDVPESIHIGSAIDERSVVDHAAIFVWHVFETTDGVLFQEMLRAFR